MTNSKMISTGVSQFPPSISSSWENWVIENRKQELTRFEASLFARKIKVGEFPFYSPCSSTKSGASSTSGFGLSKSTLREFFLITLSHAERRPLIPEEICLRLRELFVCLSIVITKESHQDSSFHFHVGVHSKNSSKNNCTQLIRKTFPEFEGSQCHVKFHKGWGNLIGYITKEDRAPYVWGVYSVDQILSIGDTARKKKKVSVKATEVVLDHIRGCDEWLEIYKSPEVRERLLYGSYSNVKSVFEDLRVLKEIELTTFEKLDRYLEDKEREGVNIEEYAPEDIGEKYLLLDWIAVNLAFKRPIKTKQLHLYGPPSTQKTFVLHSLKKVMRIYLASSRVNDFTGADDFYDLWVYDEFHQLDESSGFGPSESSNSSTNTLLKVLDGQECRLDAKYSRVFRKNKNVPIIIISNGIAPKARRYGPFQARFMRLKFVTSIPDLCEDRLIATLRGCILRRLGRDSLPRKDEVLPSIPLSYNSDRIDLSLHSLLNCPEGDSLIVRTDKGELVSLELFESAFLNKHFRSPSSYFFLRLKLSFDCLISHRFSALRFALVPLRKRPEGSSSGTCASFFPVFRSTRIGSNFRLIRSGSPDSPDFLVWPIRASFQNARRVWSGEIVLVDASEFDNSECFPSDLSPSASPFCSIMRGPGDFLQLTLGPVSSEFYGDSFPHWDDDFWSDSD